MTYSDIPNWGSPCFDHHYVFLAVGAAETRLVPATKAEAQSQTVVFDRASSNSATYAATTTARS